MNVSLKELSRDEAKVALDRIAESKGITITASQLIKNLALTLFTPAFLLSAVTKKVIYMSGVETEDGVLLEFLAEIPRAFRPTLYYYIWLVIPKSDVGEANIKQLIKTIVEKTGVPPLTDDEWEGVKPIIEKFMEKLEVKGATENLWRTL